MRIFVLIMMAAIAAGAQNADSEYKVYTEHPRLLLSSQRLRLLKRERERRSPRFVQLETLVRGGANLPEAGFGLALFHQATAEEQWARKAIDAALRPATDVRQVALVYDWCQEALTDAERSRFEERLRASLKTPVRDMATARDRAFAALAVGDARSLGDLLDGWWRKGVAPELRNGTRALSHAEIYPFAELLHAIRDNLQTDLRDDVRVVFRDLPLERVLSYYPAPWPAAENEYHIPYLAPGREPDLRVASLTRAGEMALVAYENNAQEMQFLQGWLQHDRFALRGAFGAPYEFLWANPYQPGLPYEKLPLRFHNERTGTLLARSSWEDDALWIGSSVRGPQGFREGRPELVKRKVPIVAGEAAIFVGDPAGAEFAVEADSPRVWYLLGLAPETVYHVEVDYEGMYELRTDRGGIAELEFTHVSGQKVFVHRPRVAGTAGTGGNP